MQTRRKFLQGIVAIPAAVIFNTQIGVTTSHLLSTQQVKPPYRYVDGVAHICGMVISRPECFETNCSPRDLAHQRLITDVEILDTRGCVNQDVAVVVVQHPSISPVGAYDVMQTLVWSDFQGTYPKLVAK